MSVFSPQSPDDGVVESYNPRGSANFVVQKQPEKERMYPYPATLWHRSRCLTAPKASEENILFSLSVCLFMGNIGCLEIFADGEKHIYLTKQNTLYN